MYPHFESADLCGRPRGYPWERGPLLSAPRQASSSGGRAGPRGNSPAAEEADPQAPGTSFPGRIPYAPRCIRHARRPGRRLTASVQIFHIKSSYFKQKFFALFSVWGALPVPDLKLNGGASAAVLPINRAGKPVADPPQRSPASPDADTRRAAPPSLPSAPAKRDETASPPTTNGLPHQMQARDAELAGLSAANTELTCKLDVLRQQCDYLGRKAKSFDDITSMMASDMPEVAAMVDLMMERERDDNEQKNAKVLQILRAKDTQIRDLEDKVRHTADDCLVKASAIVELQKSLEVMRVEFLPSNRGANGRNVCAGNVIGIGNAANQTGRCPGRDRAEGGEICRASRPVAGTAQGMHDGITTLVRC